jgi:hypothetical protein
MLRDVTSRLDQELVSINGIPAIAFPNVDFTPNTSEPYLSVQNTPAEGVMYNMDRGQNTPGFYSINIFTPQGNGPAEAENIADMIADHFAANRELGGNLYIEEINFRPGLVEDPFYLLPLDINWRVYHYG